MIVKKKPGSATLLNTTMIDWFLMSTIALLLWLIRYCSFRRLLFWWGEWEEFSPATWLEGQVRLLPLPATFPCPGTLHVHAHRCHVIRNTVQERKAMCASCHSMPPSPAQVLYTFMRIDAALQGLLERKCKVCLLPLPATLPYPSAAH